MLRSTLDLASSLERARRRPHKRTCHINFGRARAVEDGRGPDRAVLGEGERVAATSPT
jgi:hypothetical protein